MARSILQALCQANRQRLNRVFILTKDLMWQMTADINKNSLQNNYVNQEIMSVTIFSTHRERRAERSFLGSITKQATSLHMLVNFAPVRR